MSSLSDVAGEVRRCNRCGFCQEVCPTYVVTGRETAVARGRNRLIRLVVDGRLTPQDDPELRQHLYSCLLCGACAAVCPPGVQTDKLVATARAELTRRWGQPVFQRAVLRGVLMSPRRLSVPVGLARLYRNTGLSWVARHTGLLTVLRTAGYVDEMLPRIPPSSLRARLRVSRRDAGTRVPNGSLYTSPASRLGRAPRARVVFFLGCVTDNVLPAIGEAAIGVLERNGYEVTVLDNSCCGIAHQAYGDLDAARTLARANIAALTASGADVIVSDCASCLRTLREYAVLFQGQRDVAQAASEVSGKVRDISQLLVDNGLAPPRGRVEVTATYHDPCHLGRGLGVRSQPREILGRIPGVTFRELPEADWCCGGAGSYNITHPAISGRILERKMGRFRETRADLLASSCPSCLLQLGLGLRRSQLRVRLAHPIQLLWQSYLGG